MCAHVDLVRGGVVIDGVTDPVQRFDVIAAVARALTVGHDVAEVIDVVVRQGMAGLGADGGSFAVVDPSAAPPGELVVLSAIGYSAEAVAAMGPLRLDLELPLIVAARDNLPGWVHSWAEGVARFPALAGARSGSQSWAAMPLVDGGQVFGVIGVSFTVERSFSEREQDFLRALADVAALALAGRIVHLRDGAPSATSTGAGADPGDITGDDVAGDTVIVCAWSRMIKTRGEWLTVDQFLRDRLHLSVTHGIHPDVVADVIAGRPVTVNVPVRPIGRPAIGEPGASPAD